MSESTQILTLTDFLLARIAQVESIAQAAGGEMWFAAEVPGPTMRRTLDEETRCIIDSPTSLIISEVGLNKTQEIATHISVNSPIDVLADCEAKRAIIRELRAFVPPLGYFVQAERILGYLALPYADHPDYREEWRP